MSRRRLFIGEITLLFVLGCRLVAHAQASAQPAPTTNPVVPPPPPTSAVSPGQQGTFATPQTGPSSAAGPISIGGPTDTSAARMALPVTDGGSDGAGHKWYIITASLRETYDDNAYTSSISANRQQALETTLTPSLLIDFPRPDGDFSARFTPSVTYYEYLNHVSNTNNATGSAGTGSVQYTGEIVAQYNHDFSERASISASDDMRYYQDPSILESIGTNYQNGPYFSNNFSAFGHMDLTTRLGMGLTYGNTVTNYFKKTTADTQNFVENNAVIGPYYSLTPEVSLLSGVLFDDTSYKDDLRGYTSYAGFLGTAWQVLPSLSVRGQAGATIIQTVDSPAQQGSTSTAPYAYFALNWTLGARSSLNFTYSHEITPSDQIGANAQESDRLTANFTYQISSFITAHLAGIYTYNDLSQSLLATNQIQSYNEQDYGLETGLSYHYSNYLSFTLDATVGGVSSDQPFRTYHRDQISFGVTGTY